MCAVWNPKCIQCHQEKTKVNFLMVAGSDNEDKPLKIPKEVWILVNHLYTKACDQVRGFEPANSQKACNIIIRYELFLFCFFSTSVSAGGLVPDSWTTGGAAKHHRLSGHQHPRHTRYPCSESPGDVPLKASHFVISTCCFFFFLNTLCSWL